MNEGTSPIDGNGAPGALDQTELASLAERQSATTVAEFGAQAPKRLRGQRGPDKHPRRKNGRKLPVADLGESPGASPLAENSTLRHEDIFPYQPPAFDAVFAETLVNGVMEMLNEGASALLSGVALKEIGDSALAKEIGEKARMTEATAKAVKLGALETLKKYSVDLSYGPEVMLFGGLIIWGGGNMILLKRIKQQGAERRAQPIP